MPKLNNSPTNLIKEANKCLRTAVSQFYYCPHIFFNEDDCQSYFYSVFYHSKYFGASNRYTTKDGKKTNLLHLGYGSARGASGKRYWYDSAILNPRFVSNNNFNRVASKERKYVKSWKKEDLIAVFELKYVQSGALRTSLEKDHRSLKNAKEVQWKYMVIFDSSPKDRNIFQGMNFSDVKNFRLVHIRVYFDKRNKKHVEVDIRPNNFLNLPTKWLKK